MKIWTRAGREQKTESRGFQSEKNKESGSQPFGSDNHVRWAILIGVTIIFAIILYPNLVITKPSYKLGDVVERDIKAPKDFFIEDKDAAEIKRKQVMDEVLTVYDHNTTLLSTLRWRVNTAFGDLRAVFEAAKENKSKNSTARQNTSSSGSSGTDRTRTSWHDQVWQMKGDFEEKIGITVSSGAYSVLEKEEFSHEIAGLITRILGEILENGVVANKEIFLEEIDKGIILRDVETKSERVVQNLRSFYGLDQAKAMVRIIGQPFIKDLNYNLINLIADFVQRLIQPNITLNRSATVDRKKKAAAEIKPVLYRIKAGEMLMREGERVTDIQCLKLKALQNLIKKEQILASGIGAAMIILCLLITTYILHINQQVRFARNHNRNLLFIASMLVTFFILAGISASLSESLTQNKSFAIPASSIYFCIPIAAGAMIVCLFMGIELAVALALLIAVGTAVIFQDRFVIFIYFLLNSTMAAYWMRHCRERNVFIKAGLKIGLLNMILVTAIDVYMADFSGFKLLWDWAFGFLGGIGAGIVAAGIEPIVEVAFDYTSDIKLLELANLERPILRRLMIEAPGTYHHCVIVGSMVEAAASEIGANPLLAKVCGYYHDIGKVKQPLYFIENQEDGKNRHDKLAPSMSSLILIAHVKNGVEIARENKLGQVIVDTIRQHHGTSLISFFYDKAKQLKGEDGVNIENFRYPGPKPQTREAGLVMLADVVEAASRTLDNPTPARIQGLVQNLINKAFSDGQLDNCELTLKDLNNIVKNFNKMLNGIHHHRIEYPEKSESGNGKKKNGSPDRQPAKQVQDIPEKNSAKSADHLKRLGQA